MTRIACFYLPMFALAARLRNEPELRSQPLVITEGNGSHAHVIAAIRSARKKGIRAGMSLPQARAIMPSLIARTREAVTEQMTQEALFDVAEVFSPRIEDAGHGVVYLDVSGMEQHYATEADLARSAIRIAGGIGLLIRAGIAASKLTARVAAELPQSPAIIRSGEEADFLAPLPLRRLSPSIAVATMLQRWGISTIGALARLSESDVASRLGETGRELHTAARGIDLRPIIPRPHPPEFREGMELEWPIITLEAFLFVAHEALERLTKRMELQGLACKAITMTLTLDPDGYVTRSIEFPAPTRDVKTLLTLLRLDLEKTPPGAPVTAFMLTGHPDRPRRAQLSLFGPAALSPEKLATTIARLVSMLGEGRVGMPMTVDGHLPERHAVAAAAPPTLLSFRQAPQPGRYLSALRVFRPPILLEVMTRPSREDEMGEMQIEAIHAERINGTVRVCAGPWRVQEGWWRNREGNPEEQQEVIADREYWDVELSGGRIYRVYRERANQEWYSDGEYGV